MNKELQTINAKQPSKVEDLSRTSNDMKNLLDSTDIAPDFRDNVFRVRRFTTRATQIFKLIPGDVGRPLNDIIAAKSAGGGTAHPVRRFGKPWRLERM